MYWDMQHGPGMQHGQILAAYTRSSLCCVSISMLHVHVNTACPSTCCVSMSMLHCMLMSMLNVHVLCPYPCSIDIGILHGFEHVAWICSIYIKHVHIYSMLHVPVHTVCPCPCCMSTRDVQVYAARTWTCGIEMGIQHRHGHASQTRTCRMDMDTQHTGTCSVDRLRKGPKISCYPPMNYILQLLIFRFVRYFGEILPERNETRG